MSDWYYRLVVILCRPAFIVSSRPVVLHAERSRRAGAFIIASNHFTHYDAACLIRHSQRRLDWVSIVEAYRNRWAAWFLNGMNAFPLDRSHPDAPTVRTIYDRLERGRVVAMFPEGAVRTPGNSVINGGTFKPGVVRIAQRAGVPIMPCVVLGMRQYARPSSWMPLRRIRYGLIYGEPLEPGRDKDADAAVEEMIRKLSAAYQSLYRQLSAEMNRRGVEIVV